MPNNVPRYRHFGPNIIKITKLLLFEIIKVCLKKKVFETKEWSQHRTRLTRRLRQLKTPLCSNFFAVLVGKKLYKPIQLYYMKLSFWDQFQPTDFRLDPPPTPSTKRCLSCPGPLVSLVLCCKHRDKLR